MARPKIIVIGAGVSGLTTALQLAEAGLTVRVISRDPPAATTSAAAGASWGPYLVEDQRALHWSEVTRRKFQLLAEDPASGVRLVNGVEATDVLKEPPSWARTVDGFRMCHPDETARLPERYVCAWRYRIPLVDMPVYLGFLAGRLAELGVRVEIKTIAAFDDLRGMTDVVVNCSGLGSRSLAPDPELKSVRGQIVVVENPGIDEFFQDDIHSGELTYILPHGDRVVLGGSATSGSEFSAPIEEISKAIIQRCIEIEPRLRHAKLIETKVGFRPSRRTVRLEQTTFDGLPVIHNYGHGGSGVTLSWGCAEEVKHLTGIGAARQTEADPSRSVT